MHRVIYYIIAFIILGGAGMAKANKKAGPVVRRQRWIKYFAYIFITGVVILSIFFHLFYWLAWIIVAASLIELGKVNMRNEIRRIVAAWSFLLFVPIATGFILFAEKFDSPFLLFVYFQVLVFDAFC